MKYNLVFESNRINYVNISEYFVQDYLKMINDEEVQKFVSHNRRKYDLKQELEWIKNKLDNKNIIFSMLEKDTNSFIGNVELINIKNNIGEIGIAITPNEQNNGYGTEAIKAFSDFLIKNYNLDGIELYVFDFNKRAIHCYEKAGFIKEGNGRFPDEIHMIYK